MTRDPPNPGDNTGGRRHERTAERGDALDHGALALLGILTICTYGSWYYAFGVLFDPIREDTGWSEAALAASFSWGTVLTGAGSLFGGRMLDQLGTRTVFLTAGGVGGGAFLAASAATDVVVFAATAALGMGMFGALGFYHVTMTVAVRTNPGAPTRAIAVLTLWGALASAIFLPLAAFIVERLDWRTTMRILVASSIVMFLACAALIREVDETPRHDPPSLRRIVASMLVTPASRAFTGAVAFGGMAMATLLVYQVPAMTAAGLSLTTAATMAAVRGVFQLSGRLPIAAIVRRVGIDRALLLAFGALASGGAILAVAGTIPVAFAFAALAGFGIGAFSPLQGMKSEELYPRATLGVAMGFQGAVLMLAGSIGPVVTGVLSEQTGDRRWAAAMAAGAAVVAGSFVVRMRRLNALDG